MGINNNIYLWSQENKFNHLSCNINLKSFICLGGKKHFIKQNYIKIDLFSTKRSDNKVEFAILFVKKLKVPKYVNM